MSSIIIRHRERYGPDRPIVRIPDHMTRSQVNAHPDAWSFEIGWCKKVVGGWRFMVVGDDGGTTNQFVRTLAEVRAIAEAIEEG